MIKCVLIGLMVWLLSATTVKESGQNQIQFAGTYQENELVRYLKMRKVFQMLPRNQLHIDPQKIFLTPIEIIVRHDNQGETLTSEASYKMVRQKMANGYFLRVEQKHNYFHDKLQQYLLSQSSKNKQQL